MTQPIDSGQPTPIGGTATLEIPPEPPPPVIIAPQISEPQLGSQNPDGVFDYLYANNLVIASGSPVSPSGVLTSLNGSFSGANAECFVWGPTDNVNMRMRLGFLGGGNNIGGIWGSGQSLAGYPTIGLLGSKTYFAGALEPFTGTISINGRPDASAFLISNAKADAVAVTVKGAVSQTSDLVNYTNNAGGILARVTTAGNFVTSGAVATGGKPGVPTDADVTTPVDGMMRFDSTNNRFYMRIGGVWRYAALT